MITLTDRFERIFDLNKRSSSLDIPTPAPIQRREYVTFSKMAPKGLTVGEVYKVDHIEVVNCDYYNLYWKAEAYINLGIKTPSGWQDRGCILVQIHYRAGIFQFGRSYEFLGTASYWNLKKRIEEYLEAEKSAYQMSLEHLRSTGNPHEEGTPAHIGWQHAFDDLNEEEEEEEDDFDIDPEYEERKQALEYVSRVCGGLTASEARDIMEDR